MAYRPCMLSSIRRPGKYQEGGTVWEQHDRYFRARGEERDPLEMFDTDLLGDLRKWRKNGEEIILMGDFNQNIQKGKPQETLTADDIGLEEQFRKLYDKDAPFSHMSGSTPICSMFVTSGINYEAALILKHKAGVGAQTAHI